MPGRVHCLDHTPADELATFSTAGGKQDSKVMFTVLSAFKLIEGAFREGLEALSTHEAVGVPHLPVGVDDLLLHAEALPTSPAGRVAQRHPCAPSHTAQSVLRS